MSAPWRPHQRLAVSILCGLVLTVASAWIPAAFLDVKTGQLHNLKPSDSLPTYIGAPKDWTLRTWHECWGRGLRYDLVSECIWAGSTIGASPSTYPNRTLIHMTVGFPMPCMQWALYADSSLPQGADKNPWYTGLKLPGKAPRGTLFDRALPLRPIVWPTLVNVAAYSLLAYAVATGLSTVRTHLRQKRGLCTRCGYALAGLPTCPECGTSPARPALPPT